MCVCPYVEYKECLISIQGSKGHQGHLGETGPMGEQAAMGFIGPKGSRGTTGFMVKKMVLNVQHLSCANQNALRSIDYKGLMMSL